MEQEYKLTLEEKTLDTSTAQAHVASLAAVIPPQTKIHYSIVLGMANIHPPQAEDNATQNKFSPH